MANNVPLVVYPVKDLAKAKQFFTAYLGTEPYADSAYYVGYKAGNLEFGLDPNGTAVVSYLEVEDISATLQSLTDAGGTVTKQPTDVDGGLLIAQLQVDGCTVGLRQLAK